jgi:mono/diheme cytochrome c family protein
MTFKTAVVALTSLFVASVYVNYTHAAAIPQEGKTQWDGVYSAAQAKRGEALYKKECSECHGEELEGKGEAASLVGGDFAAAWNELTLNDLFERMRIAMPKEKPGSLTRAQYADAISYILSKNGAPAGKTELGNDAASLKTITYKMDK